MLYNVITKAGLMLLLTAPAPITSNLWWRPDAVAQNIQQLSLLPLTEHKICKQCGESKPRVKFLKNNSCDGRSPRCRECTDPPENQRARDRKRYRENPARNKQVRDRVRKWNHENAEHVRIASRARYQANKAERSQRDKEHYSQHKEAICARNKQYRQTPRAKAKLKLAKERNRERVKVWAQQSYQRHREKRLAEIKAYRKAHPEVKQVAEARRYARKKGAKGVFGVRIWRQIIAAYGPHCLKCKQLKPLTIDHVVPISQDGFDCVCNIQPLCLECNVKKSIHTIDYRPFVIPVSCPHREILAA